MSADNLLFEKAVGALPEPHTEMYREPISADIKLVQNGYQLHYEHKRFNAKNLEEALELIKSWMEMGEKSSKKEDKENTDHE